jgi:AcrR family transcriptional regulator
MLENRRELVKQRLIDAAIKVIGSKGFRKTTVPVIAKKAGIGTGTFYLYYKDKSHIFVEAIISISTRLRNYIDGVFQERLESMKGKSVKSGDIEAALSAIYNAFFDYVDNYRNQFIILFREGFSRNEDFAGVLWQTYKNLADDTRIRILTAVQLGFIRPLTRAEAETISWAMVGMLSQVAQWYITDTRDRKELIKILVDFSVNGIRKERRVK